MAYWLIKSDPDEFSFTDLEKSGSTVWNGVSNNLALIHLRSMAKGDLALVYHTGGEKAIVGIARIERDPYPDPQRNDVKLVVVDLKAQERLAYPVSLSVLQTQSRFAKFELVRLPRLSVMPVPEKVWAHLLKLGSANAGGKR